MGQMKELYNKVASDKDLQAKFAEVMKAPTEDKLIAFAKEAGFDVSIEEFKAFADDQMKEDLSETELDLVAGGKSSGGTAFGFALSFGTFGIGCIVVTIWGAQEGISCDQAFEDTARS